MQTVEVVLLVFLSIVLFLAFYYFFVNLTDARACNTTEHPACPTYSCGLDPSSTHPTCIGDQFNTAYAAFRVAEDETIMCQDPQLSPLIYRET